MDNPVRTEFNRTRAAIVGPCVWIALSLASCSPASPAAPILPTGASPRADTPAPAPTDTLVGTVLPAPIETANPAADAAATQTAFTGAIPAEIESKMQEIGESMEDGEVAWADPSTVAVVSGYQEFSYRILEDLELEDFIYHGHIRWDGDVRILKSEQVALYCSILFRTTGSVGNDSGWWYEASLGWGGGTPVGTFWTVEDGAVPVKFQRKSDDIIGDGYYHDNEVVLIVKGTQWDLYVNGKQILVWWDTRMKTGGFGFGARDYLIGGSQCLFSENWIWKIT